MSGPLGQILMLMVLTTGLRTLGKWVGPRRSGMILGLPSTTAMVLLGCGIERGLDEATIVAEACLAGLIAAVMLPVAYSRAVARGWRLHRTVLAAVLGYLTVAIGLWWLPGLGPVGSVAAATIGVLLACVLVRSGPKHTPGDAADEASPPGRLELRWLATRAAVPTIYVIVIRTLRWLAGPQWSGRFVTFPGGSLALLIATHVEAGPAMAGRLAAAMPSGSFGTLAFLAAFRHFGPQFGLAWGTLAGYLASLTALVTVEVCVTSWRLRRVWTLRLLRRRRIVWRTVSGFVFLRIDPWVEEPGFFVRWFPRRRCGQRPFAPRLECLAG